jgi:phosphoglycerate dehydrogenase-like enzyme
MSVVILEDWNRFFAGAPGLERLRQRLPVTVQHDQPADQADLLARLDGARIVVLNRERTRFDAAVIAALPGLELIVQTGGLSPNLDLAAATAGGVAVCAAPGLPNSIDGVAELAVGLLLSLARGIPAADRRVRAGDWAVAPSRLLSGGMLGIIGLGRLGRAVARLGSALRMRVIAAGPTLTPERAAAEGAEFVSLEELCARADAIFVCTRLSERTRGLVGRRQIGLMRPTAYLINVARGPIVDEAALVEALAAGRLAGAGLDVFDREPLPADHPLLALENVILTPHIGWVTAANCAEFVDSVVDRITRYLDGDTSEIANPAALAIRRDRA